MFRIFCVGIHRYSAFTLTSLNLISHVCEKRKFAMVILHCKQGLLSDKKQCSITTVNGVTVGYRICSPYLASARLPFKSVRPCANKH